MRQLNYIEPGTLEWHDAAPPRLNSDKAALIRPTVVSTCDVDGAVISGAMPLRGPVPVGHEGVGEVIEVGDAVSRFQPGDRVLIPWKISCGECAKCQAGFTAHCRSVPREASYGWGATAPEWGGFLSDLVLAPWADHMLCPMPPGVDEIAASGVADNITDGWRAVADPLSQRPGGRVLVAGGAGPGSIGLYAAAFAVVLGAGEVTYLDWDSGRREVAEGYGCRTQDTSRSVPKDLDRNYDVTVDASGNPEILSFVLKHTGANGICTCTAGLVYVSGGVPVPIFHMYRQSITLHTGWVHTRPLMEHPLGLISDGSFDPSLVTTAVSSFDEAPQALSERFTKLIFTTEPN